MAKMILFHHLLTFSTLSFTMSFAKSYEEVEKKDFKLKSHSLQQDALSHYSHEGYVIIKNLFSKAEINEITSISHDLKNTALEMAIKLEPLSEKKIFFKGTQFVVAKNKKGEPIVKRVVWACKIKENLLKYGRSSKILTPVSQILGSQSANHLISQLHFKIPGDGVTFPWHTDLQNRMSYDKNWIDVNGQGSYIVAITAIDKITLENAPLYIIPKSHLLEDLVFKRFSDTESLPHALNAKESSIPLLMERGDTVFMHPKLIHGSWDNNSQSERKVFINGFSYPGANHTQYPGEGSGELIQLEEKEDNSLKVNFKMRDEL